jgi:hypothetical protein
MRLQSVSLSSVGSSPPILLDHYITAFSVGFGVEVSGSGGIVFTVQHTFDNPLTTAAANLVWFNHNTVVNQSATIDGNYAFPVAAIRLNVTSASGSTATLVGLQAGMGGK